jgi:hypothetical protein
MDSLQKLTEIGRAEFGLSGSDLFEWVAIQQNEARDERMREREERERERECSERERERECSERERERERQCKVDLAEIETKKTLELARLEVQALSLNAESNAANANMSRRPMFAPKLVPFTSEREDFESYLLRFERLAQAQNWPSETYAPNLSECLTGEALEVFARLSTEDALNYDTLKRALCERFQITEEGYKRKFRSERPKDGESYTQFLARISHYFDRWVELGGVGNEFVKVRDLLIREQLANTCNWENQDLTMFVKEHDYDCAKQMAELADKYVSAHGRRPRVKSPNMPIAQMNPETNRGKTNGGRQRWNPGARNPNMGGANGSRTIRCYTCQGLGHMSLNCPLNKGFMPNRNGQRPTNTMAALTVGNEADNTHECETPTGTESQANACVIVRKQIAESTDQQLKLADGSSIPIVSALCNEEFPEIGKIVTQADYKMPVLQGYLGKQTVAILRDTGCSGVIVRRNLVREDQLTGRHKLCVLIDGTIRKPPEAIIDVDSPYYCGKLRALCFEKPVYDLILGNVPGVRDAKSPDAGWKPRVFQVDNVVKVEAELTLVDEQPRHADVMSQPLHPNKACVGNAVETRDQRKRERRALAPLQTCQSLIKQIGPKEMKVLQDSDVSLDGCRRKVTMMITDDGKVKGQPCFTVKGGLLYRMVSLKNKVLIQLVVPVGCREDVVRLGHDSIMAGHLGVKKTFDAVSMDFFWPGIGADVKRYCQSCDVCQKTVRKGTVTKAPLVHMPLIDTPFKRVAVDLVGPIWPLSERKNRYILTLVDYATRYPEAVPLPSVETERVAEALVDMFSRVGVPEEILTDMGAQFTSGLMAEVSRLLSMKQLTTTPYHPMCNGLVERFNGTLKQMLKRMCKEKPKDWDRYICPLLFAYREVPQASTGFSPFELLYGRTVRGPITILKELWTGEGTDPDVKTTYQYVFDLRERLEATCRVAQEELHQASVKYKRYYDAKAKKVLKVGDRVLILLPTDKNKLLMQWKGPFPVVEKLNSVDFRVIVDGKTKTFHANLLKRYFEREVGAYCEVGVTGDMYDVNESEVHMGCGVICEDEHDQNSGLQLSFPALEAAETPKDLVVSDALDEKRAGDIMKLVDQFKSTFTDLPGRTHLIECDMKLTSNDPIRVRPYPVPYALRDTLSTEIKKMLDMGVIVPSNSAYCSPLVMVKKPDGSIRSCVDFRRLNRACVFNAEPMPSADEIFAKLATDKFFTKIDLSKGYWQIPMTKSARQFTAFGTPDGLFEFTVMPFGLVTAPAIFTQMMRKLLWGLKGVDSYIDDILIHTETWDEHVSVVQSVLQRLQNAGLTARPSKCFVGFPNVGFLGHQVGEGTIGPCEGTMGKIGKATRPKTKKQVRSFLGLTGYYSDFIPNYAAIAAPLSDLTKKNTPNTVPWGGAQEKAFHYLKHMVESPPVLRLPDISKQFYLRTDASNVALGAVLLQEHSDELFPVKYASRKLQPRERNYSVTERECLAIVWGVRKFYVYLYGREFVLQTDHQSLTYLDRAKLLNSRVLRWALTLQDFKFRLHAIKGSLNVGADYLSRID